MSENCCKTLRTICETIKWIGICILFLFLLPLIVMCIPLILVCMFTLIFIVIGITILQDIHNRLWTLIGPCFPEQYEQHKLKIKNESCLSFLCKILYDHKICNTLKGYAIMKGAMQAGLPLERIAEIVKTAEDLVMFQESLLQEITWE